MKHNRFRKRIALLLIVLLALCLCACHNDPYGDAIKPVRNDLTFDEAVDICSSVIDLDIRTYCTDLDSNCRFEFEDYRIHYVRDYAEELENRSAPNADGEVIYYPDESEYHILSLLSIDGFKVVRFDDREWAMTHYCSLESTGDYEIIVRDGLYNEGYSLITYMHYHSKQFSAYYYLGDIVVIYTYIFDSGDVDSYQRYLDFCEALGLPTSDQITQEVMDSAS